MGCEWIGFCALKPEAQAAWAQAVFSVVGIFVAVLVPWWQHNAASDIRASEARVKAIARAALIFKGVKELCARIDRAQALFDAKSRMDEEGWKVGSVAIPQSVMDQVEHAPDLGKAGGDLIKAINHCFEVRDLVDSDNYLHMSNSARYEVHLMTAKTHADAAFADIKKLLD